ncbi:MAG: hypothetical protein OEY93_07470, partial [Anaerolineae bacterium]|nr:hypothetical protein [Anaerolineae bacterium]
MYLKGSKWQLRKRRQRQKSNPVKVIMLILTIALVRYFDQFVVVEVFPSSATPTPTATANPEVFLEEAREHMEVGNLTKAISS